MSGLESFFEVNRPIMFSVYGQVFFVMGLVVLFQYRRHSRLKLAGSLWLLAAFGILHGFSKWAYVFVPIQAEYMPEDVVSFLWIGHAVLEALSFAFLFQFGVSLIWHGDRVGRASLWSLARWLPSGLFLAWLAFFCYVVLKPDLGTVERGVFSLVRTGDAIGRYSLALPGATLAAFGLLRQARDAEIQAVPRIAWFLKGAAACLAAYAVLAGVFVPRAGFFPATVLNYDVFRDLGIPVHVFRSLCGLALVYFIAKALEVFDVEMERKIDRFERERALAAERERIGRDLHDGTIQSIYAAGLALEDVVITIDRDPAGAKHKANEVMATLNRAIGDIRKYILDLTPRLEIGQFENQLGALAHEFADMAGMKADIRIANGVSVSADCGRQLLQVAREALANAAKHSKAKNLVVVFGCQNGSTVLRIQDDGCGMEKQASGDGLARMPGNGLKNIARRMEMIGGSMRIESAPGGGTALTFELVSRGGHE